MRMRLAISWDPWGSDDEIELRWNKLHPSLLVLVNHFSYFQVEVCWLGSVHGRELVFFAL